MIDRYVLSNHKEVLEKYFNATFIDEFVPRYNAAPTQKLPVITLDRLSHFQYFKWGFIANWANNKSMSPKLFNINTETLLKKVSHRKSLKTHRFDSSKWFLCLETFRKKKNYTLLHFSLRKNSPLNCGDLGRKR